VDVVQVLLGARANVHVSTVGNLRTPLHCAATRGKTQVIAALLNGGADVNQQDHNGVTPLHFAALGAKLESVKLLLKQEADFEAAARRLPMPRMPADGTEGWTPLMAAVHAGAG
jgi:ankyrin repeat protein